MKKDVIIIGAGAAGLMCAIEAGKRGRNCVILDHSDKVGRKIIISGGGRCNFTNMTASPINYLSNNRHFCKSALIRFTAKDFLEMVNRHQIPWHEKKLGQLFCDRSSKDILNMLLKELEEAGVELLSSCKVLEIKKNNSEFLVKTSKEEFTSESLVIATGGLSVPGTGASGFGYKVAEQFGLKVVPTRSALVPLLWNEVDQQIFGQLSGISLNCRVVCKEGVFFEDFLFTHKGLSGPAILQISSFWEEGKPIEIDLLPTLSNDFLIEAKKKFSTRKIQEILQPHFPRRVFEVFSKYWLKEQKSLAQISDKELAVISDKFKAWKVYPISSEGYKTAEVTLGGVDTDELSSKTMESKNITGLYFVGEVVDVTGWLGGYNFQWAWSSGWSCGQYC